MLLYVEYQNLGGLPHQRVDYLIILFFSNLEVLFSSISAAVAVGAGEVARNWQTIFVLFYMTVR